MNLYFFYGILAFGPLAAVVQACVGGEREPADCKILCCVQSVCAVILLVIPVDGYEGLFALLFAIHVPALIAVFMFGGVLIRRKQIVTDSHWFYTLLCVVACATFDNALLASPPIVI